MDIDKLCGYDSIRGWTIRKVIWGGGGGEGGGVGLSPSCLNCFL